MPRVVHLEIGADDPERAVEFYRGVFGWNLQLFQWPVPDMPDYWMVITGDQAEPGFDGGLMKRPSTAASGEGPPRAFVCTIGVDSVDDYLAKVTGHGGTVHDPKMEIPGVGWIAYCLDTERNLFGILEFAPGAMG